MKQVFVKLFMVLIIVIFGTKDGNATYGTCYTDEITYCLNADEYYCLCLYSSNNNCCTDAKHQTDECFFDWCFSLQSGDKNNSHLLGLYYI